MTIDESEPAMNKHAFMEYISHSLPSALGVKGTRK